jgi:hypothetical protein
MKTVTFYEYRTARRAVVVGEMDSREIHIPLDQFKEPLVIGALVQDRLKCEACGHPIGGAKPREHYVRKWSREVEIPGEPVVLV